MFSIISNRINIKAYRPKNTRKEYSKAEQIPTEILQEILSYLHPRDLSRWGHQAITRRSIPFVCKAWHDAAMRCLYRSLDLTDDSSPRASLVLRTLKARGDLADYVTALHFPWSLMVPESRGKNMKILKKKLTCYAQIVPLCHNLVTLSVPAILHSVLFSSLLPCVPLQPSITNKLVELKIIGTSSKLRPFILQGSFSSLRSLELVDLTLTVLESPSPPPFPHLPSLESLSLINVSAGKTHAEQIITGLKGTLKHLNIQDSSLYCSFIHGALPIIGSSLETFGINEEALYCYCHTYIPDSRPLGGGEIHRILPSIPTFSVGTSGCGKFILHCLPSNVSVFRIVRPCCCADDGESSDVFGYDPIVELLDSLTSSESHFFENYPSLFAIILAGKACSWQNAEAMHRLELLCRRKGVKVVPMWAEDPCTVALPNSGNKLHSVPGRTSRVKGFFRDKIAGRFH